MAQKLELIFFRLALLTGAIVAGLSLFQGLSLLATIYRGVVSFLLIYLLGYALTLLWQKVSPQPDSPQSGVQKEKPDSWVRDDLAAQDSAQQNNRQNKTNDTKPAGQINMESLNKLADAQIPAEMMEKMVRG